MLTDGYQEDVVVINVSNGTSTAFSCGETDKVVGRLMAESDPISKQNDEVSAVGGTGDAINKAGYNITTKI